jgi:hypothetical protein
LQQLAGANVAAAASDLHALLPYISVADVSKLQASQAGAIPFVLPVLTLRLRPCAGC